MRFVLDEASSLGQMDALYAAVQYGRSFGIRSTFLFQALSQVERVFPESQRDDFLASAALIFAGTNDLKTAKEVSEILGQSTIANRSVQTGFNWGGSAATGIADPTRNESWGRSESVTVSDLGRALLRPEEVLTLPRDRAIALLPGVKPVLFRKVPDYAPPSRGLAGRVRRAAAALIRIAVAAGLAAFLLWAATDGRDSPELARLLEGFGLRGRR